MTFINQYAVRGLERLVGLLRSGFIVVEQVPEDGDLRLAHRGADMVEHLVVLRRTFFDALGTDRGGERLLDQAVVGDRRTGHVEDYQLDFGHSPTSV